MHRVANSAFVLSAKVCNNAVGYSLHMAAPEPRIAKAGTATLYRYELTSSTMDRAKELCKTHAASDWLLITATQQASGRGTGGRTWVSPAGNTYMSICVPKDQTVLPFSRLMYLPLETGVAVAQGLSRHLPEGVSTSAVADKRVSLKWPNDVLIGEKKVSGNLIEDAGSHMVVGIGVNVAVPPEVVDGGRVAGCLGEFGCTSGDEDVALAIFHALKSSLLGPARDMVAEFSALIDWQRPVFERNPDHTRGAECIPVKLTKEGHLTVKVKETGLPKTLISEYLY